MLHGVIPVSVPLVSACHGITDKRRAFVAASSISVLFD